MENNLNRILIETTVRKTINQIQHDPERSIRNLVDMALNFSEGRFQRLFLEMAQEMLKNDQSCYYRIIHDMVSTVDQERIITFGMNVGYNSCTYGAETIRAIKKTQHYNIPWCIVLEISGETYYKKKEAYHSLIEQGEKLGIYTWTIYSLDGTQHILELAEKFPKCAFAILCSPNEITDVLLDEANSTYNLMFVVKYTDGVDEACTLLRSRGYLYSIFFPYQENDINRIINGEILSDIEILHPLFTIFIASTSCPLEMQASVYQYVCQARTSQALRTIPFDLVHDNHTIDDIISDEACSIGFNKDGAFYSLLGQFTGESYNFFEYRLDEILKNI